MIEVQGKQIATSKIQIKELFKEDMWFNIPDYQRPYVWKEEQISTLLDDISHAAVYTPDSQYFLGSVVLHCEEKTRDTTKYIENSVLDGQQRLTTLYLLHAVIRDITTKETRINSCSKVIFQEGDSDYGIPERLRLEFAVRDEVEEFVNQFIKEKGATNDEESLKGIVKTSPHVSVKNMANAILLIRKWFTQKENISIDILFPYLSQKVIVVYVASALLEDAFRLFTVLNDRGIKLRNSDILKAENLAQVDTEANRKKYAKFWEGLEGELEEDFDKFLSYLRTILVKEKARNNLHKEFEDNIYKRSVFDKSTKKRNPLPPLLMKGNDTFEFVKKYKKHYDQIFSANNYHINNNWAFDNLIAILSDTAPSDIWIPPILSFREHFGDIHIYSFLVELDNKFSADWICKETPTTRIESMNKILSKIEEVSSNDRLGKEDMVNVLLSDRVFDFNTSMLNEYLDSSYIYRKSYDRYLLRKIDFLMDAPLYTELRNSYQTISVEHILPRNPASESQWLIDFHDGVFREEWTNAIGNLALISRRKNSSQGRLDFMLKKEKYFNKAIETFPNSLKLMQSDEWTPDVLEKNQERVLELLGVHYGIELDEI